MNTFMSLIVTVPFIVPMIAWVPIIIGVIIALVSGTVAIIVYQPKKLYGWKISVLGMQMAGKTQLLANIRNIPYLEYDPTQDYKYEAFKVHLGNRDVKIRAGKDIGGGDEYCSVYEDLMKESDIIFFVFDGYRYLNEKSYKDNVQARLSFIHRHLNKQEFVTFITHKDSYHNKKDTSNALNDIIKSVSEKKYRTLFNNNIFFLDMRQKDELLKELDKLFK